MRWIDTHCHLDAPEFGASAQAHRAQAALNGVALCVLPAVQPESFGTVRALAHDNGDAYALGIHPLYVEKCDDTALVQLAEALQRWQQDPRLVAVGEIGLDFFVPELCVSPLRERQQHFYLEQLKMARRFDLPVLLHVRRSVDSVLKGLREVAGRSGCWHGIAHAFNGSAQQAKAFLDLGLKLGFGGALTFERAMQLRRLAKDLPLEAIVMETDAPDMPPHWLYRTSAERAAGQPQGLNSPAELPRIGSELAALRGINVLGLAQATTANSLMALPRLCAVLNDETAES